MAVYLAGNDLYPVVACGKLFQHAADVRLCRMVISDAKFPIRIDLRNDRLYGSPQPLFIDVINRKDHGNQPRRQ